MSYRVSAVLACLVFGLANIAQASLGPFPVSSGGNSINISDPSNNMFGAVPTGLGAITQWGPFNTAVHPTNPVFPNLNINIINGANNYAMQKATVVYESGLNRVRLQDYTIANGTRLEIIVTDVAAPAINAATQFGQINSTAASVYTFNLRDSANLNNILSTFSIAAVPEPSAFALGGLVVGLVGSVKLVRNRFRKKQSDQIEQ